MYFSLFDAFLSDPFFSPHRTFYVVSDSELEELNYDQSQQEVDNLEESRKRSEANYNSPIKMLDEREKELQAELTSLTSGGEEPMKNLLKSNKDSLRGQSKGGGE